MWCYIIHCLICKLLSFHVFWDWPGLSGLYFLNALQFLLELFCRLVSCSILLSVLSTIAHKLWTNTTCHEKLNFPQYSSSSYSYLGGYLWLIRVITALQWAGCTRKDCGWTELLETFCLTEISLFYSQLKRSAKGQDSEKRWTAPTLRTKVWLVDVSVVRILDLYVPVH